jgi:hypothetical protein
VEKRKPVNSFKDAIEFKTAKPMVLVRLTISSWFFCHQESSVFPSILTSVNTFSMSANVQSTGSGFGREIAPSGYSGLSDSSRALGGTAQALQPDGGAQIQNQAPPVSGGPGAGSGEGDPQAPIGSDQRQQSVRGAHNQNQAQASSGSPSAGGGEGTAQAPNESATQGGNFMAQRILAECELVVGHYRHRRISKGRALHEIHEKLTVAAAGSSLGVESSFNSFLAALEDCDKQDSGAANRGRALASAQGLEGGPSDANRESSPPALERPEGRSNALEGQYPWVVTEIIESALQPLVPPRIRFAPVSEQPVP